MILPTRTELISLFRAAPQKFDPAIPWDYNNLIFKHTNDQDDVTCEISPSYASLTLHWRKGGQDVVWLDVNGIQELRVEVERGRETLVATFSTEHPIAPLRIQLHPTVTVFWGTDDG